jgi:hypothetical protein
MVPKGIIVVFKTLRETRSSRSRLNFHITHQTCWNVYPWIRNASSLNGCVFYQMRWLKCREIGCCSYSLLRQSFENDDTLQLLLALDQLLLLEGKLLAQNLFVPVHLRLINVCCRDLTAREIKSTHLWVQARCRTS